MTPTSLPRLRRLHRLYFRQAIGLMRLPSRMSMVKTRHFDGSRGPTIWAGHLKALVRTYESVEP